MGTLRIGLPKGRLFTQSLELLGRTGIHVDEEETMSRRLVFPDVDGSYEFVSLKAIDIPTYVESGAIEMGIVGTDTLRESERDVYEPLDLRIGRCRMVLASPTDAELHFDRHLRIASKYPLTTRRFFASRRVDVRVFALAGSVEIAPLLGLADGIVDLVETGRTLRENGLRIVENIADVSAKLIVNRTAMKITPAPVNGLIAQLDAVVYANG